MNYFLTSKNKYNCKNKQKNIQLFHFQYPFTISYHFYGISNDKNHWDVFIDINNKLKLLHYSISRDSFHKIKNKPFYSNKTVIMKGFLHRRKYLNFSGKITHNRGRIKVIYKDFLYSDILLSYRKYPKKIIVIYPNNSRRILGLDKIP